MSSMSSLTSMPWVPARESRSTGSVGPQCRICFQGCYKEALCQTCHCRGSIGLVHRSCLEKWMSQRRSPGCDICGFTYEVEERRRSYIDLLMDREARSRPLGYLLRALGLLACVFALLPLSCAFVASLRVSIFSVTLYVFSVGHSMFWFRRPVLYIIEVMKTCIEWRRNSTYVKLVLPPPAIEAIQEPGNGGGPGAESYPRPFRIFLCGLLFTLNLTVTVPLAWLCAFDMRHRIAGVLMFHAFFFLVVQTAIWAALPFGCFWYFYQACKKKISEIPPGSGVML